MFNKKILSLLLVLLLVFNGSLLGICAQSAEKPTIKYLRMVSGTTGGSFFPIGAAMMEVIGNKVDLPTSQGPGGGMVNGKFVNSGEAELGWVYTSDSYDAYNGINNFAEEGKHENLRHFMSVVPGYVHLVVRQDSNINSIEELSDKKVNFLPNTEGAHIAVSGVLNAYGITEESVVENGGVAVKVRFNDAAEMIKNNQLDLWAAVLAIPSSMITQLVFQPGVKLLSVDEDKVDSILENLPGYIAGDIPAGTYEGMDDTVHTVRTISQIVTSIDVPEDVVYDMLTALYENWDDVIVPVNPNMLGDRGVETWLDGNEIPIHPGAERFYKERGVLK